MGDFNYTLTNAQKMVGFGYVAKNGSIPGWFGICHGWSPASYSFPRPNKTVTLTAADGQTRVTFLMEDIKGLTSLFWANANYYTDFVGSICKYDSIDDIPKDNVTGLYTDVTCSSVNPGALLLTFGNQIGILKKKSYF